MRHWFLFDEFQTTLDALKALVETIDTRGERGILRMQRTDLHVKRANLFLEMAKPSFDLEKLLSHIRAHRVNVAADNAKRFQHKTFNVGHAQTLSKTMAGVKLHSALLLNHGPLKFNRK